jgi:hypothetical protein
MKIQTYLLLIVFCLPLGLLAQRRGVGQKDSLSKLLCPLNQAVEPPPEKQAYDLGVSQPKIILTSATDTTVKACINGTVTTVMKDEDGKWEVMFNNKDYYFYYSGITKVKVVKGQRLQGGDAIGIINPGDKIELMIYDFETPLEPKRYLNCWKADD